MTRPDRTPDHLEALLGIDPNDPADMLADDLVRECSEAIDALANMRKANGLTVEIIAERMGITAGAVRAIEHGDRNPHLSTLRRYAHAIGARVAITVAPFDPDDMP